MSIKAMAGRPRYNAGNETSEREREGQHGVARLTAVVGLMTKRGSLQEFVDRHRRLFVLTGAGCSTRSGIPDYRDADGQWKRPQPVTYQAFMRDEKTRGRH
jgi:Sir2 family